MKFLFCLLFALVSFTAFANSGRGYLLSAKTCMASMIYCPQVVGVDFLSDQDGRCGCLEEGKDYFDADTCKVARIACVKGATFSSLKNTRGKIVGCGCFKTSKN